MYSRSWSGNYNALFVVIVDWYIPFIDVLQMRITRRETCTNQLWPSRVMCRKKSLLQGRNSLAQHTAASLFLVHTMLWILCQKYHKNSKYRTAPIYLTSRECIGIWLSSLQWMTILQWKYWGILPAVSWNAETFCWRWTDLIKLPDFSDRKWKEMRSPGYFDCSSVNPLYISMFWQISEEIGLLHVSKGQGKERFIEVTKISSEVDETKSRKVESKGEQKELLGRVCTWVYNYINIIHL